MKFLPDALSNKHAKSALAIGGADRDELTKRDRPIVLLATRWWYARIYSMGLFVGAALWPGVAMWRRGRANPRSE